MSEDLKELHLRGELSSEGYLKETYNSQTDNLDHKLTEKGYNEIKKMFQSVEYRREFLKIAMEEAKKHEPFEAQLIMQSAVNKVKEMMK